MTKELNASEDSLELEHRHVPMVPTLPSNVGPAVHPVEHKRFYTEM